MNVDEAFEIEYKKVLKHRNDCPKWGREFCLHCFGGGLTFFMAKVKEKITTNQETMKKTIGYNTIIVTNLAGNLVNAKCEDIGNGIYRVVIKKKCKFKNQGR